MQTLDLTSKQVSLHNIAYRTLCQEESLAISVFSFKSGSSLNVYPSWRGGCASQDPSGSVGFPEAIRGKVIQQPKLPRRNSANSAVSFSLSFPKTKKPRQSAEASYTTKYTTSLSIVKGNLAIP